MYTSVWCIWMGGVCGWEVCVCVCGGVCLFVCGVCVVCGLCVCMCVVCVDERCVYVYGVWHVCMWCVCGVCVVCDMCIYL